MLILKKIKDIENHLKRLKKSGATIGFAPTMGALHKGHISLIKASKNECNLTVCSIFINPTQFNDPGDYQKYPVTIDNDLEILQAAGCDILFLPTVKEMYPSGFSNKTRISFGFIAETLEGEHRPGHFDGMAQIMCKLIRIVQPGRLYMGQKDYQQLLIVGQLIKKMHARTKLVMCPVIREKSGLAMSSRNTRLDPTSKKLAVEISKTLKKVKTDVRHKIQDTRQIQEKALAHLASLKGMEPEYFEIRNVNTLQIPKRKSEKLIALAAVKVGGIRLIDNMLLN